MDFLICIFLLKKEGMNFKMIIVANIIKFIILCIVTFFMCKIISKNNKRISYIGTILICFSTAVIEYINSGLVESLIFGELLVIALNNLLENKKYKYLWSLLIPLCIVGFMLLSNASFQISIGISIFTICLCIILKHFFKKNNTEKSNIGKENKIDKGIWCVTLIGTVIAIIIVLCFYNYKNVDSIETKNGACYIMNYTYSVMTPFNKNIKFDDSRALATFTSVFPVGLFIAICYIFKNDEKHSEFLMPTVIVSIIEILLLLSNKIYFGVPNYILSIGFALLQIYMIVYIFANIEEKLFDLKKSSYIAILGVIVVLLMPFPAPISNINNRVIPYAIFVTECFMLLNYTDKRFWRLASWLFTLICVFESVRILCFKLYNLKICISNNDVKIYMI